MIDLSKYPTLTVAGLRQRITDANTETHYFSRENMRFAGDTMSNYAVSKPQVIATYHGEAAVYELRRKHPVKHGLQSSAYFDAETFTQRWPK